RRLRTSLRRWTRRFGLECSTPGDLDLQALDPTPGLGDALLQIPPAARGLKRSHHVPKAGELVDQQRVVPLLRFPPGGSEATQLGLAIQRVLNRVASGIVLCRDPGSPALHGGTQKRQPAPVMAA